MCELRLGKARQTSPSRVLRKRCEGYSVGNHEPTVRSCLFCNHTLTDLEGWRDNDLEEQGRLTQPMRFDATTDRYLPVSWEAAFEEIGKELAGRRPQEVDFYTSGRASLETSYMYQLFARIYGSNNLPDSSNMCHESSSVALPGSVGASVGTAILSDFQNTDCIFYFGQHVGTSSPRLLHDLQDAVNRGVKIVTFNMLREPGLERFINPQSPSQMLSGIETPISSNITGCVTAASSLLFLEYPRL